VRRVEDISEQLDGTPAKFPRQMVHPEAANAGVSDSDVAMLERSVHRGLVPMQVSDEMMPGVISLPHRWGYTDSFPWQSVAANRPGVSANDWTEGTFALCPSSMDWRQIPCRTMHRSPLGELRNMEVCPAIILTVASMGG
jgi:hypothetical protein